MKVSLRESIHQIARIVGKVVPSAADLLALTLMLTFQGILLGRYDYHALAGEGIAIQLALLFFVLLLVFIMGGSILLSRYIGAGRFSQANYIFTQSLMATAVSSLFMGGLLYIFTPTFFKYIMGVPPDVAYQGIAYLRTATIFLIPIAMNIVAMGLIRGTGDTITSMWVSIFTNALNAVLAIGLIYGYMGFPEFGIKGAAIAMGISHTIGFLLLLYMIHKKRTRLQIRWSLFFRPSINSLKNIWRLGFPVTMEQIVWAVGLIIMQGYVARLGTETIAFHQVALRGLEMISVIYQGIGVASMAMVAQALGAKDTHGAWKIHRTVRYTVLFFAVLAGVFLFIESRNIITLFLPNLAGVTVGVRVLKLFALLQLPRALVTITSSTIRARGDTRWMVKITGLLAVCYEITLGYLLTFVLGFGLFGLWCLVGLDESTKYLIHRTRLRKNRIIIM